MLRAATRARSYYHFAPSPAPFSDVPDPPTLPQHEAVWRHLAGYDRLAQARAGVDGNLVPRARYWVGAEHHACHLGWHHLLHDHAELDRLLVDPLALTVGDGAIGPERGPAAPDGIEECLLTRDVQEGVLLAGERRPRKVLGGGT